MHSLLWWYLTFLLFICPLWQEGKFPGCCNSMQPWTQECRNLHKMLTSSPSGLNTKESFLSHTVSFWFIYLLTLRGSWFTSIVGAGSDQNQQPRPQSKPPKWLAGTQQLEPPLLPPRVHIFRKPEIEPQCSERGWWHFSHLAQRPVLVVLFLISVGTSTLFSPMAAHSHPRCSSLPFAHCQHLPSLIVWIRTILKAEVTLPWQSQVVLSTFPNMCWSFFCLFRSFSHFLIWSMTYLVFCYWVGRLCLCARY